MHLIQYMYDDSFGSVYKLLEIERNSNINEFQFKV